MVHLFEHRINGNYAIFPCEPPGGTQKKKEKKEYNQTLQHYRMVLAEFNANLCTIRKLNKRESCVCACVLRSAHIHIGNKLMHVAELNCFYRFFVVVVSGMLSIFHFIQMCTCESLFEYRMLMLPIWVIARTALCALALRAKIQKQNKNQTLIFCPSAYLPRR